MMSVQQFVVVVLIGQCWDVLVLGEVMLCFDLGEGCVCNVCQFSVWEGGGEYNVVCGLCSIFGYCSVVLIVLLCNELGELVWQLIQVGGVDVSQIFWCDYDGIGCNMCMGFNFIECGFGVCVLLGVFDCVGLVVVQLQLYEIDWEMMFGCDGVCWLYIGGIFVVFFEYSVQIVIIVVWVVCWYGVVVFYDFNYCVSLWESYFDLDVVCYVNCVIVVECDLLVGDEYFFVVCLGMDLDDLGKWIILMDVGLVDVVVLWVLMCFLNLQVVVFILCDVVMVVCYGWVGVLCICEWLFFLCMCEVDLLDWVGGGDVFVVGVVYVLFSGKGEQVVVDLGVVYGVLVMFMLGDIVCVSLQEVEVVVCGDGVVVWC